MRRAAILLCIVLAFDAVAAAAQEAGTPAEPAKSLWSFAFGAEGAIRYDDNILGLSPREKDQVDPSDPNNDDRFGIESPDDFVLTPDLGFRFSRSPEGGRETWLGLGWNAHDYVRNSVKDYQEVYGSVRQELNRSRAHRSALTLRGSWIPEYFVRRLTDEDESQAAGFTIRNDVTFEKSAGSVEISQEIVNRVLTAAASYARERRNYNDHFNERDATSDIVAAELLIYPAGKNVFRLRPYYEHEERDTRGDVIGTAIVDDDVGYEADRGGMELRGLWGVDSDHRNVVRGFYEKEWRDFTTASVSDTGHFGREDDITRYGGGYERELGPSWKVGVSAYHRTNEVSSPSSPPTSFRRNVFSVSLTWSVDRRLEAVEDRQEED